jgi:hypothetical protein
MDCIQRPKLSFTLFIYNTSSKIVCISHFSVVAGDALRWVTCLKSSTSTLETKVQHIMGPQIAIFKKIRNCMYKYSEMFKGDNN